MGEPSVRARVVGLALAMTMLSAVLLGAAFLLAERAEREIPLLAPTPEIGVTAATESELFFPGQITVNARISEVAPVISPGQAGVVTDIFVAPGDRIFTGTAVYQVDQHVVRAYASAIVLYRDLTVGDVGDDVKAVQRFLNHISSATEIAVDGVYGRSTAAAVRAYERLQGAKRPSGVFRRDWLVRIDHEGLVARSVDVIRGAAAPALGSDVLHGVPRLDDLSLEVSDQVPRPDGEYTLTVSGRDYTIVLRDGSWEHSSDELADFVVRQSPDADGTISLQGAIRAVVPSRGFAVPSASIIAASDGTRTCIITRDGQEFSVIEVTVVDSTFDGMALVEGAMRDGSMVVISPDRLRESTICP